MNTLQELTSTHLHLESETLELTFFAPWRQEDISDLIEHIYQHFDNMKTVEKIIGADRENYRIEWQDLSLVLNFDIYSQSCWFEAQSSVDAPKLAMVQKQLQRANISLNNNI